MKWKSELTSYFEKIKGKKEQWLILFLVGMLLLVIAIPVSDEKEKTEEIAASSYIDSKSEDDYVDEMERKLEAVLNNVQGVGKVSVMITIASSSEKVIEKDEETSVQTSSGNDSEMSSSTDRNEVSVYSGGSGEEIPYVKKEISPQIEGVLVVAEGGDNAVVVESITGAVQALFGIETHKIKVMKHN